MDPHLLDSLDRSLLNALQREFPLVPQPFSQIAHQLDAPPEEVLARASRLKSSGTIRQISAIFDPRALGYRSSLVAFEVPPERVDDAAAVVNRNPGVSHNYLRQHRYNLWFTLTVHPARSLEEEVAQLVSGAGARRARVLPALRVFKIGVNLDMSADADDSKREHGAGSRSSASAERLSEREIEAVRVLQRDTPIIERPFAAAAADAGMSEEQLLGIAADLQGRGVMRRFAAVLRHRAAGFTANAMAVWKVPEERSEEVGQIMASFAAVSHCYQRPTFDDWPYSLYTMIHARSSEACHRIAAQIAEETGVSEYELLFSTKEYKKVRVQYFTDEDLEYARRAKDRR